MLALDRGGTKWRGATMIGVDDVAFTMAVIQAEPASLVVAVPASFADQIDGLTG